MAKAELRGMVTAVALLALVPLLAIALEISAFGFELTSSLRFHLGLALLVLPLALLVLGTPWRALFMLVLIGASLGQSASVVWEQNQARAPFADRPVAASFEMMNFNILSHNLTPERVIEAILARQPDVALILEAPGIADQLGELDADYPYRIGCQEGEGCDLMLLSRTSFTERHIHQLPPLRYWRLIEAKTVIDGQSVTVVGLHLSKRDFGPIADMELWAIGRMLSRIEGPLIVSGDFNAAPWSHVVAQFVRENQLVVPPSHPATWPTLLGPLGVPIDNMFTRGGALISGIEALPEDYGSNHLGLMARVDLLAP